VSSIIFLYFCGYRFVGFLKETYTKSISFESDEGNKLLVWQELGMISFVCQTIDVLPQSIVWSYKI
jgi:hypothetical protein